MMQKIKEMARSAGFHDVRFAGHWNGYKVFEPIFSDGVIHYIGYPTFILRKGKTLRWTDDGEEGLEIARSLR